MWDVIEHLKNPEKFIEKIARESDKNARLYITTGDIDSILARFQKHKWRMIHPPSHLCYFSEKTLTRLLNNYGFKIVDISYPPVSRSIKQIYYSLFMLNKKAPYVIKKIYERIPESLSLSLNTFDIMFVIAQKQ